MKQYVFALMTGLFLMTFHWIVQSQTVPEPLMQKIYQEVKTPFNTDWYLFLKAVKKWLIVQVSFASGKVGT